MPTARLAALLLVAVSRPGASQAPIVFRNVRVFDGTSARAGTDVLIENGRIARIGDRLSAPAGATVVDGAGKTLLPGLIDAHAHAFGPGLHDALMFGVTTELDMFTPAAFAAEMRKAQAAGNVADRADLFSAGVLVTAKGGHGTEYGMAIPTIGSPDSAQAFVDARLAEGSDYIKIVYDDGKPYGLSMPTVSKAVLAAVIKAAHARGKLAVVHIGSQPGARDAIESGADGLVHTFTESEPAPDFAAFVAQHRAFVTPTLTVSGTVAGTPAGAGLLEDSSFARSISPENAANLRRTFTRRPGTTLDLAFAMRSVTALHQAGVRILAGTDAPNPGTMHGATVHRELELLVQAGLTPVEALRAATSGPADAFRIKDRGRIVPGARADLLLVFGDPTTRILDTRRIAGIWKGGVAADREPYLAEIAKARAPVTDAPADQAALVSGVISEFDDGTLSTGFGQGWTESTDGFAGGKSTVRYAVVAGGADGTARSLLIQGTVRAGFAYPWAGAMFLPGRSQMAPVDLSSKRAIAFWTKGDGKIYRVMVFSRGRGQTPLIQTFTAGPDWSLVSLPFSSFDGIDGKDVMGILFSGGPAEGGFEFRIDGVRLK